MLDNKIIVTKTITQPIILIPLESPKCNEGWNYDNKGSDWNCECSEGKEQSPINLPSKKEAIDSPIRPVFQYDEITSENDPELSSDKSNSELLLKYKDNAIRLKYNFFLVN